MGVACPGSSQLPARVPSRWFLNIPQGLRFQQVQKLLLGADLALVLCLLPRPPANPALAPCRDTLPFPTLPYWCCRGLGSGAKSRRYCPGFGISGRKAPGLPCGLVLCPLSCCSGTEDSDAAVLVCLEAGSCVWRHTYLKTWSSRFSLLLADSKVRAAWLVAVG